MSVSPLNMQAAVIVAAQPSQPKGAGATAQDDLYRLNLTGAQKTDCEPIFVKIDELLNQNEKRLQLADTYKDIGVKLQELKLYDDAINYFQKALDIYRQEHGENHEDVAVCYSSIACSHKRIGNALHDLEIVHKIKPDQDCCVRYKESVDFYQKALGIRVALFGENHPKVANSYYSLGYTFVNLADTEGARASSYAHNSPLRKFAVEKIHTAMSYGQKALAIYRLAYEENPKNVAEAFKLLSDCYHSFYLYGGSEGAKVSNVKLVSKYNGISDTINQAIQWKKPLPQLPKLKDENCTIG